jgi:putative serine protease PepD
MTDEFAHPGQDDQPPQPVPTSDEIGSDQTGSEHPTSEHPTSELPTSELPGGSYPGAWGGYAPPTPEYGAPEYGTSGYGAPEFGAPEFGAPQFAGPVHGYAPPPAFGPPPAFAPPAAPVHPEGGSERRNRTVLVAAVLAAVIGGGVGAGTVAIADHTGGSTRSSGITVTNQTAQNSPKLDGTVTAAAAKITPSVVTINVSGQSESGTGSGVILRTDGYILTNNHVVAVAGTSGTISVLTSDGRTAAATIVGTDPSDDLAVIKVSGLGNLSAATFAKSSDLVVGQSVVAVGAPLGLSNTVTAGIVSDLARPVQTGDSTGGSTSTLPVFSAIQTDAAINPGNSGGPLVNLNGDVVGIDAAIASTGSGGVTVPGQSAQSGSIGIGFAIPSDEASRIAGELIATGKATHAVIGVTVQESSTTNTATVGATIASVTANSPAASAGLKVGDVVTKVDSQLITADVDLVAAVRSYAPGTTIELTYTRAGVSATVKVKLGSASS